MQQMNHAGTLESRMRGNVQVRFGGGLSEKGGNAPRREPTQPFKRAAVKFGVARYLYRDGIPKFARERLTNRTDLEPLATPEAASGSAPAASAPAPPPAPPAPPSLAPSPRGNEDGLTPPRTGRALFAWTKDQDEKYEYGLLKHINAWAKRQEFPARMVDWDAEQVTRGYSECCRKVRAIHAMQHATEAALSN